MHARSKAYRNLVIVLVVLIMLGAGLVLLKNLDVQGMLGFGDGASGGASGTPGIFEYEDTAGGDGSVEIATTPSETTDPESDGRSAE